MFILPYVDFRPLLKKSVENVIIPLQEVDGSASVQHEGREPGIERGQPRVPAGEAGRAGAGRGQPGRGRHRGEYCQAVQIPLVAPILPGLPGYPVEILIVKCDKYERVHTILHTISIKI